MESAPIVRAQLFRETHKGFLILPNAWDAASARVFVEAGFTAVATTSGGISACLKAPSLHELEQLGVKRVSFGSTILRASLRSLRYMMDDLREQRHYDHLFEGG